MVWRRVEGHQPAIRTMTLPNLIIDGVSVRTTSPLSLRFDLVRGNLVYICLWYLMLAVILHIRSRFKRYLPFAPSQLVPRPNKAGFASTSPLRILYFVIVVKVLTSLAIFLPTFLSFSLSPHSHFQNVNTRKWGFYKTRELKSIFAGYALSVDIWVSRDLTLQSFIEATSRLYKGAIFSFGNCLLFFLIRGLLLR